MTALYLSLSCSVYNASDRPERLISIIYDAKVDVLFEIAKQS